MDHLRPTGPVSSVITAFGILNTVTAGTQFALAVDIKPNPDMHVYAPGAETMSYRVIGFNMVPSQLSASSRLPTNS